VGGAATAPTFALAVALALLLDVTVDELGLELDPQPARATAVATRVSSGMRMSSAYPWCGLLDSSVMSGHSKWASIKHKKAVVDARRGQQFTKLARAITIAAREGGGDPEGNPALALAVQKARDASMPKDNIERAIAKGTGEGVEADRIETVLYEGYGPGGVALLIEAQLSKKQILEFYRNRVYLSAGVYGVQTMSEHLFRKPAKAITLPEAAFVAGLIRSSADDAGKPPQKVPLAAFARRFQELAADALSSEEFDKQLHNGEQARMLRDHTLDVFARVDMVSQIMQRGSHHPIAHAQICRVPPVRGHAAESSRQ